MDVAFILHLNIDDVSTIVDVAADIQDDLTSAGHDVISVAPYARSTVDTKSFTMPPIPGLTPPPTQPPTL